MDRGGDGADAARRARRLAANRAASAASRKRKREVELETRRRVDALESLVRAMAAENATLREALMTVACGGGVEGGWEARKVPLPRAARDARARANENASSPASSSLTASWEEIGGDVGRLASSGEARSTDAFADEYTECALRTKRSKLARVARADEDAKTLEYERRRVGEGPLGATRVDEPRAERGRARIHMLFANALSRRSTPSTTPRTTSPKISPTISTRFSRMLASKTSLTSRMPPTQIFRRSFRASRSCRRAAKTRSVFKKRP